MNEPEEVEDVDPLVVKAPELPFPLPLLEGEPADEDELGDNEESGRVAESDELGPLLLLFVLLEAGGDEVRAGVDEGGAEEEVGVVDAATPPVSVAMEVQEEEDGMG